MCACSGSMNSILFQIFLGYNTIIIEISLRIESWKLKSVPHLKKQEMK
jgi:hypothetical protein